MCSLPSEGPFFILTSHLVFPDDVSNAVLGVVQYFDLSHLLSSFNIPLIFVNHEAWIYFSVIYFENVV